jgi:2-succinyl-6-hydroxy-2,4-cyclohexadiene-1-carboxylate synthase
VAVEGDRPDVVLVPGFMQGAGSWAPTIARIDRRYRALALEHAANDVDGRLEEIESAAPARAALVGYSLGGRLALRAALRAGARPGRYGALALVGSSAGLEGPRTRAERCAADERFADWMEANPIEAVVERWERLPALAGQAPELVAAQRPERLRHDPALLAALLRSAGQGVMDPVWESLPRLDVPLLAVAGERDRPYVAAAERMAALAPRGRAATVPGAGHAAHLEEPEAFTRLLLEFLDEHLGERRLVDVDS